MPYAVELALDDATAAVVRVLWRDLAAAGFRFMHDSGANPHVSLAIWDDVDRPALETGLAAYAAATPALDVVFSRVDAFTSTGVVFLAPDVNAGLLDAHAGCHQRLGAFGREAWPHYAPGVWVPHCTLAMDIPDGLDRALGVARKAVLPLRGRLVRAELVAFRPVRCLAAARLAAIAAG